MSDWIGHECGIAAIRLLKPLDYYIQKYGTPMYGINKLTLLMEKQHNRGQDGAGAAVIKLDMPPGDPYICISVGKNPIMEVSNRLARLCRPGTKSRSVSRRPVGESHYPVRR